MEKAVQTIDLFLKRINVKRKFPGALREKPVKSTLVNYNSEDKI